eukprot:6943721-Alexandrium_andersonii.AAC.1
MTEAPPFRGVFAATRAAIGALATATGPSQCHSVYEVLRVCRGPASCGQCSQAPAPILASRAP